MRWKDKHDIDCNALREDLAHNINILKELVRDDSNQFSSFRQQYIDYIDEFKNFDSMIEQLNLACTKLRHMSKKNKERIISTEHRREQQLKIIKEWQTKIERLEGQLEVQNIEIQEASEVLGAQQLSLDKLEKEHDHLDQKYLQGQKKLEKINSQLVETLHELEKRADSLHERSKQDLFVRSNIRSKLL